MQARTARTLLTALACAALACPAPDSGQRREPPVIAEIPPEVRNAQLELTARVPQGTWRLGISSAAESWETGHADPSARVRLVACDTYDCRPHEYELDCPHGHCEFTFESSAERDANGDLNVEAEFMLDDDPGNDGCNDGPNPAYVPAEDRERLFVLSWTVSAISSFPPDLDAAAPDGVASDAAPADDAAAPAGDAALDGASAEAAVMLEPVRVLRGDPARVAWWDLTVRGAGLGAYEGVVATVRIGDPAAPPERLGSGQARVTDGAFSLVFPAVWEASLYKYKRAYLDVDGNGRCDPASDLVFSDARAANVETLTILPDPSGSREDFPRSTNSAGDCAALDAWPMD